MLKGLTLEHLLHCGSKRSQNVPAGEVRCTVSGKTKNSLLPKIQRLKCGYLNNYAVLKSSEHACGFEQESTGPTHP